LKACRKVSLYGYTRLPLLQRVCSEVSADPLSYKRNFSYLPAGFRQLSDMSNSVFPFRDGDIQKEKDNFLHMPLNEKREYYRNSMYYKVDEISTWEDYFLKYKERLTMQFSKTIGNKDQIDLCSVASELNKKVSMWEGNITHLETDAIVNAANSRLCGGGGVDGAIHYAAGAYLKAECASLGGCVEGDAKMTGGYCLPAKYVIHTVGPHGEKPDKLESCYRTSLELLITERLRTVAFPCISTGIYGYPQEEAAHVAVKTIRTFLEKNQDEIDRIIFCLYMKSDVKIYENLMQVYFPAGDTHSNL
jgi:O-acetyl-ADP-ribose deacetylase (regulator of RNase III)